MYLVFATLLFILSISGLQAQHWQSAQTDTGFVAPLHGVWESRGYGWVLDVRPDRFVVYNVSPAGCLRDDESAEYLVESFRLFERKGETLWLTFRPENSTQYTFDRLAALPASCASPPAATPRSVFDYTWGVMDAHYAFFDLYDVDWDERYAEIAPRITDDATEAELRDALLDLLDGLKDGHLSLTYEIDGERDREMGKLPEVLNGAIETAFAEQEEIESRGQFASRWFFGNRERIRSEVLDSTTVERASGGNVFWGRSGRVGYVNIAGMGGFADETEDGEDAPFEEEVAAVHRVMTQVLTDLADTDALIVDVALNQGGYDEISLAIASHFAAEPTLGLTKYAYRAETDTRQSFTMRPAATIYHKPVYLLTSDVTVSAAETFSMHMRALPNVTHVGSTTRGALSDVLMRPLPNGWLLTLSNEIYLDAQGELWEGRGIPPEEPMPIFEAGLDGHVQAIEQLIMRFAK